MYNPRPLRRFVDEALEIPPEFYLPMHRSPPRCVAKSGMPFALASLIICGAMQALKDDLGIK